MSKRVNIKDTGEYQEVFFSEKHQRFYFKRSKTHIIHESAKPFMLGSRQLFIDFKIFLNSELKKRTLGPYLSTEYLDDKLDEFLGDCVKAENLLVEVKLILGI